MKYYNKEELELAVQCCCGRAIYYKNIFDWIWSNPFHTWTKRYVRCPHCGVRSAMRREKNDR